MEYDAVEVVDAETAATIPRDAILPLRVVRTDKAEPTRGDRTFDEHPLVAKTRYVSPSYADKQPLEKNAQHKCADIIPGKDGHDLRRNCWEQLAFGAR